MQRSWLLLAGLAMLAASCAGTEPGPASTPDTPATHGAATGGGPNTPRGATATPTPAATAPTRLAALIRQLEVAGETRAGYDRKLFEHWTDADQDCQDTRDEVLADESQVAVSGCDITAGEWHSYYDGKVWTRSSDVDVDHLVPLAEAWDSGARGWSAGTRRRFANDLGDQRSLVAVTDNVNQAKADQDPAGWLPDRKVCRYIREWAAVKARWSLAVDRAERQALLQAAQDCNGRPVRVRPAPVEPGPPRPPAVQPTAGRAGTARFRFPPPPPDLDCGEVDARNFRVRPGDPHGFDADGDGVGCES